MACGIFYSSRYISRYTLRNIQIHQLKTKSQVIMTRLSSINAQTPPAPAFQPVPPVSFIPVIQHALVAQPQADVVSQLLPTLKAVQCFNNPMSRINFSTTSWQACSWRTSPRNHSKCWYPIGCTMSFQYGLGANNLHVESKTRSFGMTRKTGSLFISWLFKPQVSLSCLNSSQAIPYWVHSLEILDLTDIRAIPGSI